MKKSTIPVEFLVSLILVIAIISITIWGLRPLFRYNGKSMESFNSLLTLVDNFGDKSAGEIESHSLYMDVDTTIIFLGKKHNEASVRWHDTVGNKDIIYSIPRPSACIPDKSCICLCRELSGRKEEIYRTFPLTIHIQEDCSENLCKSYDLEVMGGCDFEDSSSAVNFKCAGGYIIERTSEDPRIRALYIEKISDNKLAFCTHLENEHCRLTKEGIKIQI